MSRPPLRRLTGARLALSLALGAGTLLAVVAILPLVGVERTPAGARRLVVLDLGEILHGGNARAVFLISRLPRALAGALAGAGLAAAGATLQAILRNPLAEPFTLGVSSGAALGAVLAIRLGVGTVLGSSGISLAAFLGAAAAATLVWRLARVGRTLPPATLLLAGVTLALVCSAGTMLVQYTSSFAENYRIARWMMGGLDWIPYPDLGRSSVVVLAALAVLLALGRDLNALAAGRAAAASVGVDADRSLGLAFGASALIVGAVVAVAGPIGFVGLIVPHALRGILGPDHRALLPASMLFGGAFVVFCDTLARLVHAPNQLPVGLVTALLGGPFFLWLLVGEKSRGRLWSSGD